MEGEGNSGKSLMEDLLGLLRIRIKRGVNLAVRDVNTSDPYVVVKMGKQVPTYFLLISLHSNSIFTHLYKHYLPETQDSCH